MGALPLESIAIEGPARTGKTRLLLERTLLLLNKAPTDSILVLCSNYYRKNKFLEAVQDQLSGGFSQLQVTTYPALVRNTISLFWPCVEAMIAEKPKIGGSAVIFPELSGFEASEYLLKRIITLLKQRNPDVFQDFQGSERSLVSQLIRRIRLRAENRIENDDMYQRSKLIGEPCLDDIKQVLGYLDVLSLKLRVFDSSRQLDIFHKLIAENPEVQSYFSNRIKHLIVDDVDETIPAQQHLVKFLAPTLETLAIAADIEGGTRRGYLNAYPYDWPGLKQLKADMKTIVLKREDAFARMAQALLANWKTPESNPSILPVEQELIWRAQTVTRLEMLEQAADDILHLLQSESRLPDGTFAKPGDLAIVMPKVDPLARFYLQQQFRCRGIPLQILIGTERPTDNVICRSLLLLLQLVNQPQWHVPLSALEFKGVLNHALKLNQVDPEGTESLVQDYRLHYQGKPLLGLPPHTMLNPEASARYQILLDWLETNRDQPIDEQLYSAFKEIISLQLTPEDSLEDIHQLIRSLYIEHIARTMLGTDEASSYQAAWEWFVQVKTGVIADTPNKPKEIDEKAIVLASPQKLIDFEIERQVHFWLDVSSREWSRTDNAPLYNAWVHSVNWDGDTNQASDAFNQQLTRVRAGHITRTLMLYPGYKVFLYSSELDEQGHPHSGYFHQMLLLPENIQSQAIERANLRDDQAKILEYQGGPMAITAVPGAGKTFVNVELLLELIGRGVPADNILVLTYMDSAARTLLNRLKKKLPGNQQVLPMVCTIHSLALRILREDDHALYLGLDTDHLQILDPLEETAIMLPMMQAIDGGEGFFSDVKFVLTSVKYLKENQISPEDFQKALNDQGVRGGRLFKLALIYDLYCNHLAREGLMDFTSLMMHAVKILESFPEVRQKYQTRFQYVIEDEAQDSSRLLQHFIGLITQDHTNLVRTGDPNQSIMSFSTADPTVFRDFIAHCQAQGTVVEMNQSGRCALEIMDLANHLIQVCSQEALLKHAFQEIQMQGVSDKNPLLLEPIQCREFENELMEKEWMASTIHELQRQYPEKSIAVLTRGNFSVLALAKHLQEKGIKAIGHSESPGLHPVFILIVKVLKLLEMPGERAQYLDLCKHLQEMGLLSSPLEYIESILPDSFMTAKAESIEDGEILQLYYHLQDLSRYYLGQDICRLVVRVTDAFLTDPSQRSIGYLCALKTQEWVEEQAQIGQLEYSPLEWVNLRLQSYLDKGRLPFKIVQDVFNQASKSYKTRFVEVMTLHKSKGQEFDIVFIPEMTEANFPANLNAVKWTKEDKFIEELDRIVASLNATPVQDSDSKKIERLEEEARLLYVGITRAREALFLSCALERQKNNGKSARINASSHLSAFKHYVSPKLRLVESH